MDVKIPGLGGGLSLNRTWNSMWPPSQSGMNSGLFGPNWRSTYEERVFMDADGTLKYSRADGSFWSFQKIGNSPSAPSAATYQVVAPANVHASISYTPTQWTVTFLDGERRVFDTAGGNLIAIVDKNGNTTQLSYDATSRLVTVTDPASRHLYFTYGSDSSRLVTGISSNVGITLSYAYDGQGRLTQVTKPDLTTLSFGYDSNSKIASVTDSNGTLLESHTYDSSGRGLTSSRANGVDAVTVSYGTN
jgi:YD repeat-containing protein